MVNVLLKSLQRTPKGYKNLHRVVETEKRIYFEKKKYYKAWKIWIYDREKRQDDTSPI